MDPRVIAAFASHGGVLARAQLLDLGLAPGEITRLVKKGVFVRLRRGVYTTAIVWSAADEYVGRPLLMARAAVAMMRRGWVLSHDSGAHAHGLPILPVDDPLVHVTRPGWTNAWTENGVAHHLARFDPRQVEIIDGYPVHDLARVAVDIARQHGFRHGLIACDGALRRRVTRADLQEAVAIMKHWPGGRAARRAVDLADPGAENMHETLGRELVMEAGIGTPETQFPVRTSDGVRWCDLRVGNHVIECDGRIKYLAVEDGGVARTTASEVAWEERKRERLVKDRRLIVTRVYWEDYWGRRREAAIRRLRADAADAVRLYGVHLDPQLAREAAEIRRSGDRRRAG